MKKKTDKPVDPIAVARKCIAAKIKENKKSSKTPAKPNKLFSVVVGEYGSTAECDNAAMNFRNPEVFRYMSAVFPEPRTFKVEVKIVEILRIKQDFPRNPMNPYSLKLSMQVDGDVKGKQGWIQAFLDRASRYYSV